MAAPRIHGRFERGFAWQPKPSHFMQQSSTALVDGGRVWLIDPLRADGIDDAIKALGTVAGIVMTVGWHDRDVDWFAALYGVPVYAHHRLVGVDVRSPVERISAAVPDSPLQIVQCSGRGLLGWWRETALWWPEHRTLVAGDCLGNAAYFGQPPNGEEIAVHPVRRFSPPVQLRDLPAERFYSGHGTSVETGAAGQIRHALDTATDDLPRSLLRSTRAALRGSIVRG